MFEPLSIKSNKELFPHRISGLHYCELLIYLKVVLSRLSKFNEVVNEE